MKRIIRFLFLFLLFPLVIFCQEPQKGSNSLAAQYSKEKLNLDGKLDENAWQQAPKISHFTQKELNEGEPATEKTRVSVVYTTKNLYVGVRCFDNNPSRIIAKDLRRDFTSSDDDNFKIILDTYNDNRNGFLFITNPNGARRDGQVLNNGNNVNISWDGVWDVETQITDKGWFAEIKIPFTTLKYDAGRKKQIWGINFERNIRRKREKVLWQGWSRDYSLNQVNQAGKLLGLDKLLDKDFVEVKPYGLGGGQTNQGDEESRFNLGGNVNYLITPTVKAQLTVNTDFAQVEADPQKIELTRFPLRFPEKRSFFLEGKDYFSMGFGGNRIEPFYSRRIGLTKDRKKIPILAGTRVLGKVRNTTLGFMSLQTGNYDQLASSTNYTVANWRQNVLRQSTVGAMTINKFDEGGWHTTTGINGQYRTSRFLKGKNLNVTGALVHTRNSGEKYKPDANAYRFSFQYPNDKLTVFASYQSAPEEFQPEVGLRRRPDFREAFGTMRIKPRPGGLTAWIQQFRFIPFTITYDYFHGSGELQTFSWNIQPLGFDTRSGESFGFSINRSGEGVRKRFNFREGIGVPEGTYWETRYNIDFSTFPGRTISGKADVSWGGFFGGRSIESAYSLRWRANKHLDVVADYEKNWVYLPEGYFDTDLIGARLKYAINPDLFGSLYTQWNDRDELANLNFRLEWIPKIGTNFYFIVNQNFNTKHSDWRNEKLTILGKVIWRFVI